MDSTTSNEAILADYIAWVSTFSRDELLKETIRLAEKQLLTGTKTVSVARNDK